MISNFDYRIYAILEALELSRHFDSITISSEAGYAKPAPEIFRMALQRHSVPADEALHVGDSEALDVAGAHAAGVAAVLVDPDGRWAGCLVYAAEAVSRRLGRPMCPGAVAGRGRRGARPAGVFLTRVALLT